MLQSETVDRELFEVLLTLAAEMRDKLADMYKYGAGNRGMFTEFKRLGYDIDTHPIVLDQQLPSMELLIAIFGCEVVRRAVAAVRKRRDSCQTTT